MENILLQQFSLEDFENVIRRVIQEEIGSVNSFQKEDVELLTVSQAAIFLKVSTMTIRNWYKSGKLKRFNLGKIIYFDKKEIRKALEKSKSSF